MSVDKEAIEKRFKNINNANYKFIKFDTEQITDGLSIPYREITTLKNELLTYLNDGIELRTRSHTT